MAKPTLTPSQTTSAITLPSTGTAAYVASHLPIGVYSASLDFVSGAADQVAYTFKKLGGDVLDLEITEGQVYAAYEEACLEYSYILNIHQSKNVLSDILGGATGSFDHKGQLKAGSSLSSSLAKGPVIDVSASDGSGTGAHIHSEAGISLKYPHFQFSYAKEVGVAISNEANLNGFETVYSASFQTTASVQDYDLQAIISNQAGADSDLLYYNKVGNNRLRIKRVFYKTPHAMWRFFGYYGGLNTVGNLQNYGQFADDSQFQIVPVWQNKQQSLAFEDSIYTRLSHFSYEIKNNKLRIFPETTTISPKKMWVEFTIANQLEAWEEDSDRTKVVDGVNNMNTAPFANIPYTSINSIGKQWIRRFALALCKEMLGQVRSKFGTIPIPGESLTLNGDALLSQGKEEQTALRDELKAVLDELTYTKLLEADAGQVANTNAIQEKIPLGIFTG